MAFSTADFVQETTTTTGTGTYDLAGATTGFQSFISGNSSGDTVRYSVTNGVDWEVCEGVITSGTPDTLTRGTVLASSNAGSAVNWGAGSKNVSQVFTADEALNIAQTDGTLAQFAATTSSQLAGVISDETGSGVLVFSNSPALTSPSITGTIVEDVYTLSGTTPALDPDNGSVQVWTLSGNSTPTDSLTAGEAITLMIDDGTAYTITWPTMTWVNNGGSAPTLATSGYTVVALWKVSTTLYGALVGDGT
jgi:hypothetical protein